MSEEEREAFESLDDLLLPAERDEYEQDPVAYASRFWISKDPRYLTPYNERKLTHYARLVYADLLYGNEDMGLRGWDTERGRILVRYGPRKGTWSSCPPAPPVCGMSGWRPPVRRIPYRYPRPQTRISPHVRRIWAVSSTCLRKQNTFNIWDYGDFRFVFEDPSRNGEYRMYSPPASDLSAGVPPWLNDYSIRAHDTVMRIPERYEYEAPGRRIEIPFLVSGFKGEDATDFYVQYGIPLSEQASEQETINISAHVGAFLINDRREILVERRRTIYGLRRDHVRSFEDVDLWVGVQEMSAPPGDYEVSMEFETASGATVAVQRREVEVPDFTGDDLQISGIMLGYGIEEVVEGEAALDGSIRRGDLVITPAPWSVFSRQQPIYLFFEIYRLSLGEDGSTAYEIQANLKPRDDAKGIARLVKNLFQRTGGGLGCRTWVGFAAGRNPLPHSGRRQSRPRDVPRSRFGCTIAYGEEPSSKPRICSWNRVRWRRATEAGLSLVAYPGVGSVDRLERGSASSRTTAGLRIHPRWTIATTTHSPTCAEQKRSSCRPGP